jgi:hypothetical protein
VTARRLAASLLLWVRLLVAVAFTLTLLAVVLWAAGCVIASVVTR